MATSMLSPAALSIPNIRAGDGAAAMLLRPGGGLPETHAHGLLAADGLLHVGAHDELSGAMQPASGIIFGCTSSTFDECFQLSMVCLPALFAPPPMHPRCTRAAPGASAGWEAHGTALVLSGPRARPVPPPSRTDAWLQVGLPRKYLPLVKSIVKGYTLIFLFNFSNRQLHGTYIATSDGTENLSFTAWRTTAPPPKVGRRDDGAGDADADGGDGSPFPAQCTFDIVEEFGAVPEVRVGHPCGGGGARPRASTDTRALSLRMPGRISSHPRVHRAAALQVQAEPLAVPRPARDHVQL